MKRIRRSTKNLPPEAAANLTRLAEFLKWARRSRKIPIREMAKRLMVSPATVIKMEKGHPGISMGTIFRAVCILGLSRRFEQLLDPAFDSTGLRNIKTLMEGRRFRQSSKRADWGDMDF